MSAPEAAASAENSTNPPATQSGSEEPTQTQTPEPQPTSNATTNGKAVELDLPTSAADGLIQKPFPRPLETAKPETPAELNAKDKAKYEEVLKAVSEWTTVPTTSAPNASAEPITDEERMFLTRECLLRYLRATKWNTQEAVARVQRTLTWRREYGVQGLTAEHISIENETGKQVLLGYDIHGRPCLYLLPSKQNTEKSDRQVQHLVFMLERLIELMPPNQETLSLLINFSDTKSGQNASIGQAKQCLSILQNHYPERLGRALVINSAFYLDIWFRSVGSMFRVCLT